MLAKNVKFGRIAGVMEFVWVVPRKVLFPACAPHGLEALGAEALEERYLAPAREHGYFVERRWAETHPEVQQPIPYVAVVRKGRVLTLTRLAAQGEKRLHGKRSIGVGGHINPCDQDGKDLFAAACLREVHEELVLPDKLPAFEPVGVLNDDTTPVGAVHLGLVYRLDATGLEVGIRETTAMAGDFEPLADLESEAAAPEAAFETWSTLLIRSGVLRAATRTEALV